MLALDYALLSDENVLFLRSVRVRVYLIFCCVRSALNRSHWKARVLLVCTLCCAVLSCSKAEQMVLQTTRISWLKLALPQRVNGREARPLLRRFP